MWCLFSYNLRDKTTFNSKVTDTVKPLESNVNSLVNELVIVLKTSLYIGLTTALDLDTIIFNATRCGIAGSMLLQLLCFFTQPT